MYVCMQRLTLESFLLPPRIFHEVHELPLPLCCSLLPLLHFQHFHHPRKPNFEGKLPTSWFAFHCLVLKENCPLARLFFHYLFFLLLSSLACVLLVLYVVFFCRSQNKLWRSRTCQIVVESPPSSSDILHTAGIFSSFPPLQCWINTLLSIYVFNFLHSYHLCYIVYYVNKVYFWSWLGYIRLENGL